MASCWPCSWKSNQGFSCKIKNYARFYVERKAGWDTHGLPVELEVEKIGIKGKQDIEKYGIENFINECKKCI